MTVIPSGTIAAILPWAPLTAVLRSLLHRAASLTKFAQQCAVQWSMRDFNGSLPGATADHRHFASKKIQPPPGIIRGTNAQPSGSSCGMEGINFYLLSGKHDASIEYTKTITASKVSKKKTRMWAKHRGSATKWRKFQGTTQPGTSCLPLQVLAKSRYWTVSAFLPIAFPHLLGEFIFWLNTWEVGEMSLLFNKALQTLPWGTECLHSESELNSAFGHALSGAQKLSHNTLMIGYMIDDLTAVD